MQALASEKTRLRFVHLRRRLQLCNRQHLAVLARSTYHKARPASAGVFSKAASSCRATSKQQPRNHMDKLEVAAHETL